MNEIHNPYILTIKKKGGIRQRYDIARKNVPVKNHRAMIL